MPGISQEDCRFLIKESTIGPGVRKAKDHEKREGGQQHPSLRTREDCTRPTGGIDLASGRFRRGSPATDQRSYNSLQLAPISSQVLDV